MTGLTDIFSTRELAFLIWILVFVGLALLSKWIRDSLAAILKAFVSKHIIRAFCFLIAYVLLTLHLLNKWALWDSSLTKDTIFWFFTIAFVTFLNINKAKDYGFFKEIIRDSVKWTVIIEFLMNFYTFNLWTELIILPIMTFITIIQAYATTNGKYKPTEKLLAKIINFIGLLVLGYIVYETIAYYQKTFTAQNLKSLLHPIIMTILFLPFAYLLALYMTYENLFVRVDLFVKDKKNRGILKRQIVRTANIDINKLNRIGKNLNGYDLTIDDIRGFAKKPNSN